MTNISISNPITEKEGWAIINWSTVESHVFRLQKKIYLASKEGEIRQVRKLQHRLVNSYDAKLLSTRRVTQDNRGKKTSGIDGIKELKPKERFIFTKNVKIFTKGKPLRRVWIDKPGKEEKRPLGIPTMQDRATQALLKLALEPEWEAIFEPNSYGFRPGRCTHDALKQIYVCIKQQPKYVLDADISKCFDKIDHSKLLNKMGIKGKFAKQIKSWLKAGVMDKKKLKTTERGTPQGGVISPLLANIALHGMETMLKNLMVTTPFRSSNGKTMGIENRKRSLSIVRYADDFVVMHYDREILLKCKEAISDWLKDIGLELSQEKTRITHTLQLSQEDRNLFGLSEEIKPGFNFLGFTIRQFPSKYKCGKLGNNINTLILPSQKSCQNHLNKLALIVRGAKVWSQELLIKKLNPIIIGWTNYFGKSDAATAHVLTKLDYLLYLKLRQWAKRKTKSASKGSRKYWLTVGTRNWTFGTKEGKNLALHADGAKSIRLYVKVKGTASPFDGNEIYWASRLGEAPGVSKNQAVLLKRQKGYCKLCGRKFFDEDIMEMDHVIPTFEGGKDNLDNMQLLHGHCHDQKSLFEKKPVSKNNILGEETA